jgi:hypothetical protein
MPLRTLDVVRDLYVPIMAPQMRRQNQNKECIQDGYSQ